MVFKAVIAWLEASISWLRWVVLLVSWIGIAWAMHHIDNLTAKADRVDAAEAQVKVVHDVKIIHDKVRAMPDAAVDDGLREWYRE